MGRAFMVIAHRGASAYAPENTVAAILMALDMGTNLIEVDARLTGDGEVVLAHDDDLSRATGHPGRVSRLGLGEIRGARRVRGPGGAAAPVATLEEALAAAPGAEFVVELKGTAEAPEVVERVLGVVRAAERVKSVVFSSFDVGALRRLKEVEPAAVLSPLFRIVRPCQAGPHGGGPTWHCDEAVRAAADLTASYCCPQAAAADRAFVRLAHSAGLSVRPWGLPGPHPEPLERVIDAGVDGTTTNWPDVAIRVVRSRGIVPAATMFGPFTGTYSWAHRNGG